MAEDNKHDVENLAVFVDQLGLDSTATTHDDSDDFWFVDEPANESFEGELHNREWKRRHDEFYTSGYREGLAAGKEASAQEGFNVGFKQSAHDGYKWGLVRGITSALAILPDHHQEILVKKLENREQFEGLYKSAQKISTDKALEIYSHQLIQSGALSRKPEGSAELLLQPQESSSCDTLEHLFQDLARLLSESPDIKVTVESTMTRN